MIPIELPMAPCGPPPEAPVAPAPGARRFRVEGMDCGACAKTVEQAVAVLPGVSSAQVSFGNGTMAGAREAPHGLDTRGGGRAGHPAQPPLPRGGAGKTPRLRRAPPAPP